ncbi:hypothetical protein halTADL_2464 [Halohasta litchfieldiae]|uniref:Sulfatase n=1 Tax=Halohasta litchfieldiae TaxID=1073996 RepID=A0A1H6Y6M5_9EURY|nr:hypothetical protein [Halohasta litchfieldiae]ATW89202.1 hypothetical protein halTADL_2464 [Halohasta litchfieldiae]SEJ36923.1 hypothetical protein SAMN05444271_1592 [Halohasta litchfieldiae]
MNEEWDILVILDACRYDVFSSVIDIAGTVESKVSRGSNTSEFLYGNFTGEQHLDTVYTTANPQLEKHLESIGVEFHDINHVWNSDRWDADLGTVRPTQMTEACLESLERYPNKRHIFHYLQPHYPFIGTELAQVGRGIIEDFGTDIWGLKMRDRIEYTKESIADAYISNLELALESVTELLSHISGKVVVTSDHGNMIGERSRPIPITEWGHPSKTYTPQLVDVPWLTVETGQRPDIYAEQSLYEPEAVEDAVVTDRLKDLGYV